MACGSGAFLVQTCRYLAERLVEAWDDAYEQHPDAPGITPFGEVSTGKPGEVLIPKDADERMIYARRIVAGRCLYGVDKNPLAAEMAKLSLWLLTLQKDKPFTFLDHAIRTGDSLVGIANTHQLTSFSLDGNGPDMPMFTDAIKKRLDAVRILRRQIAEMADNSAADVERKGVMLQNADQQTKRLAYAANFLLAACWEATSETDREERLKKALTNVEYNFKDLPAEQLEAEGKERLQEAGCPTPFHWPLEFPEVFMDRGGFDGIVGNPPFMGGKLIKGNVGHDYRTYLVTFVASGVKGHADLCAYFFVRAAVLLNEWGYMGLLATNTIAQGDTREVGLDRLLLRGGTITRAVASRPWPGTASLEVSHVWLTRSPWSGHCHLDDTLVAGITSYLSTREAISGTPYRLSCNADLSFIGSYVLGMGFVLEPEEAARLIANNPRNRDVVWPYLNGEDLNSRPDQSPSRYVINFVDWPLDKTSAPADYQGRVAADYPDCLKIVEEKVKPERTRKKPNGEFILRKPLPQRWWIYADKRPALYNAIADKQHILAIPRVSKYPVVFLVRPGIVFSDATVVIPWDSCMAFATMQSSFHEAWVVTYQSSLETRGRYTPSDCFETYPFPSPLPQGELAGKQYHEQRRQIMQTRQEGVTKTYNRFHDSDETAEDIQKLRELHVEMDNAVAAAYGWTDLDLGHGFHERKQGVRFTISEPARREVLARLLKLNHERYAEEVKQGLHDKKKGGGKPASGRGRRKKAADGPTFF